MGLKAGAVIYFARTRRCSMGRNRSSYRPHQMGESLVLDLASGRVWGEAVDEARHELRFDVKAATYHGLVNDVRDSVYYARVIFDL